MAMVSCLLCYMVRLGIIAAHVRTGRACTPLARCNTLDFVPKSVCQGAKLLRIPAERVRTYAGKWKNSTMSGVFFHGGVWYTRLSSTNLKLTSW